MAVVNLTPHSVEVYAESQFVNLEQINPTTWIADGVEGEPLAAYKSQGVARIDTTTEFIGEKRGIPLYQTTYREAVGIPDLSGENFSGVDTLIVSLPMKSMAMASEHPFRDWMVSPYKVVRSRENGSLVLGCMGFTY